MNSLIQFAKYQKLFYLLTAIFIVVNMYFIYNHSIIFALIPFSLLLVLFLLFSIDQLLIIIMFFAPLSLELSVFWKNTPLNMNLPTEPLLFLVMCIFILKLFQERRFDKKVLKHPVSISIYIYFGVLLYTTLTSEMPLISLKYILSRAWFIICFYFIITQVIFADRKNISRLIIAYSIGLAIVVAYSLYNHALLDFSHQASYRAMSPIFRDHTSYGAALALILPALLVVSRFSTKEFSIKFMFGMLIFFLTVGLIFSYTRAAWLGIMAIVGIWVIVKLKIKFRTLLIVVGFFAALIIPVYQEILFTLEKNDTDSNVEFSKHLQSSSNISTDESNLERINRWKAAYRMFEERPLVGWGPGTYQFTYATFQHSNDLSKISTNAGNKGNAHSEYLGLLSESGIFALLSLIILIVTTIITAMRVFHKSNDTFARYVSLYLVLGLITYYIHAFLNNFLDMDKIASLFWVFMAIIVVLDIQSKEKAESK